MEVASASQQPKVTVIQPPTCMLALEGCNLCVLQTERFFNNEMLNFMCWATTNIYAELYVQCLKLKSDHNIKLIVVGGVKHSLITV